MRLGQLAGLAFLVLIVIALVKGRRRSGGSRSSWRPGPGAAGAVYEMLSEDKRRAIEIIVEEKAEARDPETADGNLPELKEPK